MKEKTKFDLKGMVFSLLIAAPIFFIFWLWLEYFVNDFVNNYISWHTNLFINFTVAVVIIFLPMLIAIVVLFIIGHMLKKRNKNPDGVV